MKLSIITINLNNAEGLRKTLESVVNQNFTDYEYIVIDGGSTDGSADIIKQYADKITYRVSEPDNGIYNAMNKGIRVAKGEYCLFLNSGDWLMENNGLQYIFDRKPVEDIVYCDIQTEYGIRNMREKLTIYNSIISHQSTFIKTVLFSTVGYYNENNKIVSDWEFLINAIFKFQCSYQYISSVLTYIDNSGISSNIAFQELCQKERENVLKESFPMMYDDYRQLLSLSKEIIPYRNSRLIQVIRKMQSTSFYKKIKGVK
ncbi:MAG: glycosyltransferase [Bacteroidales bacterium]|jgi:glycosyltransferase involved in cell wall biosynthesis|nr:glycosyltransferase [Bacteroidales bacterium]